MSEYIQPDFMYRYHLFEKGETVVFTQPVKTMNYAFRKKNQAFHTIPKGTKAVVVNLQKAHTGLGPALGIATYKVRLEDGKVIDRIPEYVLEPIT